MNAIKKEEGLRSGLNDP